LLVLYSKKTGIIEQILLFRNSAEKQVAIEYYQNDFTEILEVDDNHPYIDIKKNFIKNNQIILKPEYQEREKLIQRAPVINNQKVLQKDGDNKSQQKNVIEEENSQAISDIITYKRYKIGLITTWNQICGIADYSRDLVQNSLNQFSVFAERIGENKKEKNVIFNWGREDRNYQELYKSIVDNDIDIAHFQYNHGLFNAGELKKLAKLLREKGIHTILTLHSVKGGVSSFDDDFDEIIVHSKNSKKSLMDEGVKEKKIKISHIGYKKPDFDLSKEDARELLDLPQNKTIISNFGFFLPQKGIKEQIKVFSKLLRKFPDLYLMCICAIHTSQNKEKSTEYYYECKELAEKLGCIEKILFKTEFLEFDDVLTYLYASDIISLPYTHSAAQSTSSAGRTVLSVRRPTIFSDVDIFSDLGNSVIKVRPKSLDDLYAKTIELLKDKQLQKKSIQNVDKFLDKVSWKNISKRHSFIYKSFGNIKMKLKGQVFSYFSMSQVNRLMADGLNAIGVDILLESVNMAENRNLTFSENFMHLVDKDEKADVEFRHFFPPSFDNWDKHLKLRIMYLPVETSPPDGWIQKINDNVDYVWTYSQHGKDRFEEYGCKKPVYVIPCGVDTKRFNTNQMGIDFGSIYDSYTRKLVSIDDDTFVFTFVGHAQKRKNLDVILKSYFKEFTNEDNVLLVIKSYDGGEVSKMILDSIEEVNKNEEKLPKHLYMYEDSSPEKIARIYTASNCMVQCSRAEGYGLPILEAMACGTPSIALDFSGPKDFCNNDNAFLVPYKKVKSEYHVQSKDSVGYWAEVEEKDLMKVMRYVYNNQNEVNQKSKNGIEFVKRVDYRECAFKIVEFLKDINYI